MDDTLIIDLPPKIREQLEEITAQHGVERDALRDLVRFFLEMVAEGMKAEANTHGLSAEAFARRLFEEFLHSAHGAPAAPQKPYATQEEWERAVDEWSEEFDSTPLPDWALTREHIYGGRA